MIKNCLHCGCEFDSSPWNKKNTVFCNASCYGLSKRKKIKKECPVCKTLHETKPSENAKYCSRKCSSIGLSNREEIKCPVCKELHIVKKGQNRKFCSLKCARIMRYTDFKEVELFNESIDKIIYNSNTNEIEWDTSTIEDIFNLSNIDIDEQLNAKSYVGSLKRRY